MNFLLLFLLGFSKLVLKKSLIYSLSIHYVKFIVFRVRTSYNKFDNFVKSLPDNSLTQQFILEGTNTKEVRNLVITELDNIPVFSIKPADECIASPQSQKLKICEKWKEAKFQSYLGRLQVTDAYQFFQYC